MSTPQETTAELEQRLAAVRAKRGYLLAHHGLMALAFPKLLDGYDAAYTALALEDRVLSHHDREFVWLAVLAATDERVATHHITKFRAAGGTDAMIGAAFAAGALAIGAEAFDFAARDWARQLAPFDPRAAYLDALARVARQEAPRLLGQVQQDGARLEHADRRAARPVGVDDGRESVVGADLQKCFAIHLAIAVVYRVQGVTYALSH